MGKKENNVLIIEDDYNGELRYSTHPMPCVQNYDTENTVYLGSFFKDTSSLCQNQLYGSSAKTHR